MLILAIQQFYFLLSIDGVIMTMKKEFIITKEKRLCKVEGNIGYFHEWEHYSNPLPASPMIGGAPAGIFNRIYGIVEFANEVRRVEANSIRFIDEENHILNEINKAEKREGTNDKI